MKAHFRALGLIVLGSLLVLLAGGHQGSAQKGKNLVWNPVVPDKEAKMLMKTSVAKMQQIIAALARANPGTRAFKKGMDQIRTEALALAAVVQSDSALAKDRKLATQRDTLFTISVLAKASNLVAIQPLMAALTQVKPNSMAKLGPVPMIHLLTDREDIMFAFKRTKAGGDGIEEKIKILARRPLNNAALKQQANAIALMAYKTAAIAQLAEAWTPNVPNQGAKKTRKNWQALSGEMRTLALQLTVAVSKGNPNQVMNAARKLNSACSRCHATFKD
jgi:hypothetical protein